MTGYLKRLISTLGVYQLADVVSKFMAILLLPVYTRYVTPTGYGTVEVLANSVIFVTHEINPILPFVDRVLYVVGTRWAVGSPAEVLTTDRLSDLYQTDIDVLRVKDQIVILGVPDRAHAEIGSTHYHHVSADGEHRR